MVTSFSAKPTCDFVSFDSRVKKVASMDCISYLPDDILHHIPSFLPTKDMLRSSVLSKKWKVVVDSYPVLDFNYLEFCRAQGLDLHVMLFREEVPIEYEYQCKFMDYVDASMLKFFKQNLHLQAFKCDIPLHYLSMTLASAIDKCIGQVIENGVKELHFNIELFVGPRLLSPGISYSLPRVTFAATSMAVLQLCGVNLKLEDSCSVELHSLRKLELTAVLLDDHIFWKLTSGCPLLEFIRLNYCEGMKNIKVAGLHKLKEFSIEAAWKDNLQTIKIEIPTLESAYFESHQDKEPIIELDACQGLKSLYIVGLSVREKLFQNCIPKFCVLESLAVKHTTMEPVKISSSCLRHLKIGVSNSLANIEIDTPNLLTCQYRGYIPSFSLINAPLCQLELWPFVDSGAISIPWYVKLKEFLANFNQIVFLCIDIDSYHSPITEISFNLEDLSNISSPFSVVENFALFGIGSISFPVLLVDYLFRYCRPNNMFISCGDGDCQSRNVEFVYELVNKENLSCCDHRDAKCWRHHLKEAKVESFENNTNRRLPDRWSDLQTDDYHYCKLEWQF